MKHTSLHTLGALVARDTRDALTHPLMLVMIAASLLMAGFRCSYRLRRTDERQKALRRLALTLMIAPVFCGSTVSHVSIAVDRPTGTYLTRLRRGERRRHHRRRWSSSCAPFINFLCGMSRFCMRRKDLVVYLFRSCPQQSVTLAGLLHLALSRTIDKWGLMSLFEISPAIVPVRRLHDRLARRVAVFFPTGPAAELLRVAWRPARFSRAQLRWRLAFWSQPVITAVVCRSVSSRAQCAAFREEGAC